MAQSRFQLTTEGLQLMADGHVHVRVGFTCGSEDQTCYYSQKQCPRIDVQETDVLGTTDEWAANNLALMQVPTRTRRAGVLRNPGAVFEDVTGSTVPGDVTVDLDPIFDTVR